MTGYSPFYLLFGRSPRLPVDMLFGLYTEPASRDQRDYVEKWKQGMEEAYAIANENAQRAAEKSKRYYDTKVRSSVLQPGERVLIKNLTPRGGPGKLRDYWENTVHTVVRQMGSNLPIYEVRPERGKGRSRVLHRNLLMSCDHLPFETQPEVAKNDKTKQDRTHKPASQPQESDEDSGDEYDLHYEPLQVTTPPAVARERDAGPAMEPECEPRQVEQRVREAVPVAMPVQPLGEEQQEELSTSVQQLPGEDVNLPARNLPDHSPNISASSSAAAEPVEPTYQLPQRERHPPRYPLLLQYSVSTAAVTCLPCTRVPHLQPYYLQPPFMYGFQQA